MRARSQLACAQMSDTFRAAVCVILSGGFQDAYTYTCRGGVFANAQTGNVVLLSAAVFRQEWGACLKYAIPLLAFFLGTVAAEVVHIRLKNSQKLHWRQIVLLCEILFLLIVGFLPRSADLLANALVSFVCAMQVQTFHKVRGHVYASTMCIGNLRCATESLCAYCRNHEPETLRAPLQYIAPYAGCAMGEYFMHQGRDVLIVYDDLSKHAVAYRALSLLLGRSPGREAYPGDVFYLHSRLLERAAHLADHLGGGSMTALPIVETQAGDVSAYILTNIISITDGQIFLESSLFFAGQRPAVNVGLSVSRVGGAAQTKAMKKAAGAIRLELAQYREMEVFMQFSSDLDDATRRQLAYGQGLMQLLRQEQSHPYSQHEQVFLLVCALGHVFLPVPPAQVRSVARQLLDALSQKLSALCSRIDTTGQLSDGDCAQILSLAKQFVAQQTKPDGEH